ncbi:MAG: hypothetical protein AMJ72_06300 [Acidithiobacillales bacterium SM1_46]|nr:MAG: hypothetical protein AMJ72_06300 [Acidithiobacillales bacterium SM1_46]
MADKESQHVADKPPHSAFEFATPKGGYALQCLDFSTAGVYFHVQRPEVPSDPDARVHISSKEFDRFLLWAGRTCGRGAFVLPDQTQRVLARILATGKVTAHSKSILRQAVKALCNLDRDPTKPQRALNR